MIRLLIKVILLCNICLPAAATTVLRWVDADGVTHFSDTPPVDNAEVVTELEFRDSLPTVAEDDYYSIANQWNRMREEREAKTKLALEKAKIRLSESAATAYTEPVEDYATYYPAYIFPYRRHHTHRPGLQPRRDRPARTGHRVTARDGRAGGAQHSRNPSRKAMGPRAGRGSGRRGAAGVSFGFNLR